MHQKLGIYAGSFNPFHVGHLDVVKQAKEVFDKVLVARGINESKKHEQKGFLPTKFLNSIDVNAIDFVGLLANLIKEYEADWDVTLVRGLRSGADLDYEQNFAAFLRGMYPKVKIVAFYCDPRLRHISSSSLRGIQTIAAEEYRKYVIED